MDERSSSLAQQINQPIASAVPNAQNVLSVAWTLLAYVVRGSSEGVIEVSSKDAMRSRPTSIIKSACYFQEGRSWQR